MAKKRGEQLPPGYLAVSRKIFEHWLWTEDRPKTKLEAWLDLLQTAKWGDDPGEHFVQGAKINYYRGELIASLRYLSQRWRWPKTSVERFIELLEDEKMISRRSEKNQTIVTILNYETYNGGGSNPRRDAVPENPPKSGTDSGTETGTHSGTSSGTPNEGEDKIVTTTDGTPSGTETGTLSGHSCGHSRDTRGTNIQEGYKKGKEGDIQVGAEAPVIDQEKEIFEAFIAWVDKHASSVNKMKEPFTQKQYSTIRSKFPKDIVQEVILAMHNKADLLKKYTSANLTCQDWCRRRLRDKKGASPNTPSAADLIRESNLKQTA